MDWDASRYHRISAPQFEWGQRVIERLQPRPGERILDIGCGTGRLTTTILDDVDGGWVVGLDRSGAMLAVARGSGDREKPSRTSYVQADGAALPSDSAFDAVFSAATLHWIHRHEAVFESVFRALRPGGRFVAQCGGGGNLNRLYRRAAEMMRAPRYEEFFRGWEDPWYFADPHVTARRLRSAGFVDVDTSLEEAPVVFGDATAFAEFIGVVCIRHHLGRLPLERRDSFTGQLTDICRNDHPPFVLDYQRLNIAARKPLQ